MQKRSPLRLVPAPAMNRSVVEAYLLIDKPDAGVLLCRQKKEP